jgi:hypothetical protein
MATNLGQIWRYPLTTPGNDIWLMPAVVVNPGDTLVVSTHNQVDQEIANNLRTAIMKQLPGLNVLVIAGADISKITH